MAMALIRIQCHRPEEGRIWTPRIVASLRESRGATLESATFIEAQLAFYESRLGRASELAERALLDAPWLYEAKALQAEIHMAEAGKLQDEEAVLQAFMLASDKLKAAQAMAPCDPLLRELECRRWEKELAWRKSRGLEVAPCTPGSAGRRRNQGKAPTRLIGEPCGEATRAVPGGCRSFLTCAAGLACKHVGVRGDAEGAKRPGGPPGTVFIPSRGTPPRAK